MMIVLAGENHPTITSFDLALDVLQRFRTQYQLPQQHEGYDRELKLAVDEQLPNYTVDGIQDIMQRLQMSPKTDQTRWSQQQVGYSSYRGQSGYRGYPNYRESSNYRGSSGHRGSSSYREGSSRRGFSDFRGSSSYRGSSNLRGQAFSSRGYGRGGSFTSSQSPHLRGNGSIQGSATNGDSSTYTAGGSMTSSDGNAR